MKAEHLIGLEILAFLLGWFIRDLKGLGADDSPRTRRVTAVRRTAPKNPRTPW